MLRTDFKTYYLKNAMSWVGCREVSTNRSKCVDQIKILSGYSPDNDPWCAQFVYAVIEEACKKFNVKNRIPRTKSTYIMRHNSKLPVDKTPAVGSIFYFKRSGGGHVGLVLDIQKNGIITVEGNRNNEVWTGFRSLDSKDFYFIHAEKTTDKKLFIPEEVNWKKISIAGAGLLGAAGTIYYIGRR